LIENQVCAAPILKKSNLKVLPTGYILIESGTKTSVEIISKTEPLPTNDVDRIVAHAIAGEMLGMKYIYLEAGSGALNPVPLNIISAVKKEISVPLIVGGGIRDKNILKNIVDAGADFVVVGNLFEKIENIEDFNIFS